MTPTTTTTTTTPTTAQDRRTRAMSLKEQLKQAAEESFIKFIELVAPYRVLGNIHRELCEWITRPNAKNHQLVLLPRDHGKSAIAGFYAAWRIVKNPAIRILLISSTSNLAEKQLKFIKDIIEGDVVRRYWDDLVNKEEGKREKWTNSEIAVDHPLRKEEGIRDPTVFTGGLTTSLTGLHCDLAILDDVVVQENAYTQEGRNKVRLQYSLLASIESADAEELAVGTRYHPKDLYDEMANMEEEMFDEEGRITHKDKVYEVFERKVEDKGDGTGNFLWAREQRADGKWFGFDTAILARKRAKYLDISQFRAQYYNDPNDTGDSVITRDMFNYLNPELLKYTMGHWFVAGHRLRIIASMDFAFSTSRRADWTSLVVLGVDQEGFFYVLDIYRIKTKEIDEYYRIIQEAYNRWQFRQIVMECNVAQEVIVDQLKTHYINREGLRTSVIKVKRNRHQGTKEERMSAILDVRYKEGLIWHLPMGLTQTLEEELLVRYPPHDDIKNALAEGIDALKAPSRGVTNNPFFNKSSLNGGGSFLGRNYGTQQQQQQTNNYSRFGGL